MTRATPTVIAADPCPSCGAALNVHPPAVGRTGFYACPTCEFCAPMTTDTGRARAGWVRIVVRRGHQAGAVVDGFDAVCAGCRDAATRGSMAYGYHVTVKPLPLAAANARCDWCEPVEV